MNIKHFNEDGMSRGGFVKLLLYVHLIRIIKAGIFWNSRCFTLTENKKWLY